MVRCRAWWFLVFVAVVLVVFGVVDMVSGAQADPGISLAIAGASPDEVRSVDPLGYRLFDFATRALGLALVVLGLLFCAILLGPYRRADPGRGQPSGCYPHGRSPCRCCTWRSAPSLASRRLRRWSQDPSSPSWRRWSCCWTAIGSGTRHPSMPRRPERTLRRAILLGSEDPGHPMAERRPRRPATHEPSSRPPDLGRSGLRTR